MERDSEGQLIAVRGSARTIRDGCRGGRKELPVYGVVL